MTHGDFLDPGTAERMLDGTVAPADAPPGFGPVAELLDAARDGVTPPAADLGALASAARAGASSIGAPESSTPGRPPVLAKFLTLKAAAVAGVVLLGATSAAAATGALPGPLQRTAHSTLSRVGVDVPSDDDDATDATEAKDHDATEVEDSTTTSTTLPGDPAAVPPVVPGTTPEVGDDHGGTEVEDESDDDHGGTEVEDESDDDHGGTTATTQPSSGGGGQESGDDHEDGDRSGPGGGGSGSSGSGSDGSGSSGHGGGED